MTTLTCPCGETVRINTYSEDGASVTESRCKCGRNGRSYRGYHDGPRDQIAEVTEDHLASRSTELEKITMIFRRDDLRLMVNALNFEATRQKKNGQDVACRRLYDISRQINYRVDRYLEGDRI